eukprot:11204284-Lingulodinium_polyedra.AAC.1
MRQVLRGEAVQDKELRERLGEIQGVVPVGQISGESLHPPASRGRGGGVHEREERHVGHRGPGRLRPSQ